MAGRLTTQERAQIAARYEVWNSVVAVQRWWRTVKDGNATIRQETIKNCHSKLLTTGSVKDAMRSGRPSTSLSEENVASVMDMFTHSLHKSTHLLIKEECILKNKNNLCPYKMLSVFYNSCLNAFGSNFVFSSFIIMYMRTVIYYVSCLFPVLIIDNVR
jgi:hypothetical protein